MKYKVIYSWNREEYTAIFDNRYDVDLFVKALQNDNTTIQDVKNFKIKYEEVKQ